MNFLNNLTLNNKNKLIIEFIGNPGSGKTSIIKNLNQLFSNNFENKYLYKENKKFKKIEILPIFFKKFIGFLNSLIRILLIINHFISEINKESLFGMIKRYVKIIKILFSAIIKISLSKGNIIFLESILHQLISSNFNSELLLNQIFSIYGYPRIILVFVDCPIDESMKRMTTRGDKIILDDIKIKKRYTQSYQAQKKLYKFCKTNNSKIKNLNSPIYINGNNSPLKNAEIIYEKIYQNII